MLENEKVMQKTIDKAIWKWINNAAKSKPRLTFLDWK